MSSCRAGAWQCTSSGELECRCIGDQLFPLYVTTKTAHHPVHVPGLAGRGCPSHSCHAMQLPLGYHLQHHPTVRPCPTPPNSGGFRELCLPIARALGVPPAQLFANRMNWQVDDETGERLKLVLLETDCCTECRCAPSMLWQQIPRAPLRDLNGVSPICRCCPVSSRCRHAHQAVWFRSAGAHRAPGRQAPCHCRAEGALP